MFVMAASRGGRGVLDRALSAFEVIFDTVTSGSAGSVTIGPIPQTFRDLEIITTGRGTTVATSTPLLIQFNGDGGSNYDSQLLYGNNATTAASPSFGSASFFCCDFVAASGPANAASTSVIKVQNYAGLIFQKTFTGAAFLKNGTGGAANLFTEVTGGLWRSTAAITSIKVFPTAGAFVDGTVVTVYGIGGSSPMFR
jgi:hypothetical protein